MEKPEGELCTIYEMGDICGYGGTMILLKAPEKSRWGAGEYVVIRPSDLAARDAAIRRETLVDVTTRLLDIIRALARREGS
jgi:hypothetical protein